MQILKMFMYSIFSIFSFKRTMHGIWSCSHCPPAGRFLKVLSTLYDCMWILAYWLLNKKWTSHTGKSRTAQVVPFSGKVLKGLD